MEEKLVQLKKFVVEASKNTSFIHHEWFIDCHLTIVEQIALELCDMYSDANRDVVRALVWVHDYPKILDKSLEHETPEKVRELLLQIGFESAFIDETMAAYLLMERKLEIDLINAPIEVKIISSADGASHLVGPFLSIHWKENSNLSVAELIESKNKKLSKDWERKIVLPEVKEAFKSRYQFHCEQPGLFPKKFFE